MKTLSILDNLRPISTHMDDFFNHFRDPYDLNVFENSRCHYNVIQTGEHAFNIEVALPGFNKDDVHVEIVNDILTIRSTREETKKGKDSNANKNGKKYLHRGIIREEFTANFSIGNNVKVEDAQLKAGLLTVKLQQKKAKEDVKKIDIH